MVGLEQALAERGESGEDLNGWCGRLIGWAMPSGAASMFECSRMLVRGKGRLRYSMVMAEGDLRRSAFAFSRGESLVVTR